MPDSKNAKWADEFKEENASVASADSAIPSSEPAANDADGWQQYRRWVTKAPAPRARRAGLDPSLYTWKGYRSWTEKVKRHWKDGDE